MKKNQNIQELILRLNEGDDETIQLAISQMAALIQRHNKDEKLGMELVNSLSPEFSGYTTTENDVQLLINSLKFLIEHSFKWRPSALWALGKVTSEDLLDYFKDVCNRFPDEDNTNYQALTAIEDRGINRSWNLIERISRGKLKKAKEFALQRLKYKKMGLYEKG